MKKIKRLMALAMVGVMCLQVTGCGKDKKKAEKLDQYDTIKQIEIPHVFNASKIIDGVLYGSYSDYNQEDESVKSGVLSYTFDTKELNEVEFEDSELYVQSIDKDTEGNIVLKGQKCYETVTPTPKDVEDGEAETPSESETNDTDSSDTSEDTGVITDEGTADDTSYSYSTVEMKYDTTLKLVSKEEGEVSTDKYDETMDQDILLSTVYMNDGKKVELYNSMTSNNDTYFIKLTDTDEKEEQFTLESAVDNLYKLPNGEIVCMSWGEKGPSIYKVDIDGKKLGDKLVDISSYDMSTLYEGDKDSVLFISGGILNKCNYTNGKIEKLLKFMDCAIDPETITEVFVLADGTLGCAYTSTDYTSTEIDYLIKQDPKKAAKKKEITMGVFYLDSDLQKKVIEFNKTNENYKIVVKEYFGDDVEDYTKALSKFNSDIVSGKCPDIVDMSGLNSSIAEYAEKGIFEDITPYIEKDSDMSMEDFVESVVNAYKVGGKIYTMPRYFSVGGYMGATSVVGKDINWTLNDFLDLAKSLPEGTEILNDLTSDGLLSMMCTYNIEKYVDWSTGKCSFNTDGFAKLLEFCANYQTSEEYYKDYDYENQVSDVTKIRDKKLLLRSVVMYDTQEYTLSKLIYGEDVSFKGNPCDEGTGTVVSSSSPLLAISAKSKNKDIAWKFVRQYYVKDEADAKNGYFYGFSLRKEDLDALLNKSMVPETYIDENGEEQISYNTWGFDDIELEVPYPTEEDINEIRKIIDSIDCVASSDDKIAEIINDETKAFFDGQKSAKEVAEVIQSRVSMYVKENK